MALKWPGLVAAAALSAGFVSCESNDPCSVVSCLNAGICANGTCVCTYGYEGGSCELVVRDRLLGAHEAQEVCTTVAPYSYPIAIAAGNEGINSIIMGNFADRIIGVRARIEGQGIVIPDQTLQVQSGYVQVQGVGTISDTSLFFYFNLVDGNGTYECNLRIPLN